MSTVSLTNLPSDAIALISSHLNGQERSMTATTCQIGREGVRRQTQIEAIRLQENPELKNSSLVQSISSDLSGADYVSQIWSKCVAGLPPIDTADVPQIEEAFPKSIERLKYHPENIIKLRAQNNLIFWRRVINHDAFTPEVAPGKTARQKILDKLASLADLNVEQKEKKLSAFIEAFLAIRPDIARSVLELDLSNLELFEIPSYIRLFTNLRILHSSNNRITSIPIEIKHLTQLQELVLSQNQIKELPLEIKYLTRLQKLNLSSNCLNKISDSVWENLLQLEYLDFSKNNIKRLSWQVRNLSQLKELNISHNRIRKLPKEIGRLSLLEKLFCSYNELKDIPPQIGALSQLRELNASDNSIKKIPNSISRLLPLRTLNFNRNQLVEFPEIGDLSSLEYLYLIDNNIQRIPSEILPRLINLIRLGLDDNDLYELSPGIGDMPSLEFLSLKNNRLISLPPEIRKLRRLYALDIKTNPLSPWQSLLHQYLLPPDQERQERKDQQIDRVVKATSIISTLGISVISAYQCFFYLKNS